MTLKKIFSTTNAARTPGNVAPGMIATNMNSITTEPRFAGKHAVQRRADRVGGQDRCEADVGVPVAGAQDEEPRRARSTAIDTVWSATAATRYGHGDRAQRVPEPVEPAADVDSEGVQHDQDERREGDPADQLRHAPQANVVADRVDGSGDGVDVSCHGEVAFRKGVRPDRRTPPEG